jgi:hypothetical protein
MKKIYVLIFSVIISLSSFAQSVLDYDVSETKFDFRPSEYVLNQKSLHDLNSQRATYKTGRGGWLSVSSLMESRGAFWTGATFLRLFPDSFVNIVSTDGDLFQPAFHALGNSFDPREGLYAVQTTNDGNWQVGLHDSYILDSIAVGYAYIRETDFITVNGEQVEVVDTLFVHFIPNNGMNRWRFNDTEIGGFAIPTGINYTTLKPNNSHTDTILLTVDLATETERTGGNISLATLVSEIPEDLRRIDHEYGEFGSAPIGVSFVYKPGIPYNQIGGILDFELDDETNIANPNLANEEYSNVLATSNGGSGARFNVIRDGDGKIIDISIVNTGRGYSASQVITLPAGNIGGSRGLIDNFIYSGSTIADEADNDYTGVMGTSNRDGSGATFKVIRGNDGAISDVEIEDAGLGYTNDERITISGEDIGGLNNGISNVTFSTANPIIDEKDSTYNNLPSTTASNGSGATFFVRRNDNGDVDSVAVVNAGSGYTIGDMLSIDGELVGGVSGDDDVSLIVQAVQNDNLLIRITNVVVDNIQITVNRIATGDTIISFNDNVVLDRQFNDFGLVGFSNQGSPWSDKTYFNNSFVSNRQIRYEQSFGQIRGHLPFIQNFGWANDMFLGTSFKVNESADRPWGSVSNIAQSLQSKVYPNPVMKGSDVRIQILEEVSLDDVNIVVYDLLGNVMNVSANISGDASFKLSTNNLAKGVYFVQVAHDNQSSTHRILVQ